MKLKYTPTVDDGHLIVTKDSDRTGILIWRGARDFCSWFSAVPVSAFPSSPWRVVELGGGLGMGALAVAMLSPAPVHATTSDFYPPALDLAKQQVDGNKHTFACPDTTVDVLELDWCWYLKSKEVVI
eukprot:PhF_6_TR6165/c0_g1_i2/m.9185